jgi:hypothetical protein
MIYTTPSTDLLDKVDEEGNPVVDFSQIVENSAATVRRSLDGTLFIAKFKFRLSSKRVIILINNN